MSQIRLYIDEDAMHAGFVSALRLQGIDTITAFEASTREFSDEMQLQFASQQNRVLYSFNRSDFCRIHSEWMETGRSHSGIILAKQQRYSVREEVRRLLFLINTKSAEQMRDSIEFLGSWD